jgi:hypothetical protein
MTDSGILVPRLKAQRLQRHTTVTDIQNLVLAGDTNRMGEDSTQGTEEENGSAREKETGTENAIDIRLNRRDSGHRAQDTRLVHHDTMTPQPRADGGLNIGVGNPQREFRRGDAYGVGIRVVRGMGMVGHHWRGRNEWSISECCASLTSCRVFG